MCVHLLQVIQESELATRLVNGQQVSNAAGLLNDIKSQVHTGATPARKGKDRQRQGQRQRQRQC